MLVLLIWGDFELLAFVVRGFTVLNSTRDGKEGLARELRIVLSQSNGWAWMNSFFFFFFFFWPSRALQEQDDKEDF